MLTNANMGYLVPSDNANVSIKYNEFGIFKMRKIQKNSFDISQESNLSWTLDFFKSLKI